MRVKVTTCAGGLVVQFGDGGFRQDPHCGCLIVYFCRRPSGAARWRCKACRKVAPVLLLR